MNKSDELRKSADSLESVGYKIKEEKTMLKKEQVLPIGSVVTVRFDDDVGRDTGQDTLCIIVGHLTLQKGRKCCYDYMCVEYPSGMDDGLFYINHDDIESVLWHSTDFDELHAHWMDRKYAEYVAYYKNYNSELRPSISEMRAKSKKAGALLHLCERYYNIKRWMCAGLFLVGAVLTGLLTKSWYAVAGAFLFAFIGWFAEK